MFLYQIYKGAVDGPFFGPSTAFWGLFALDGPKIGPSKALGPLPPGVKVDRGRRMRPFLLFRERF